MMTKQKTQNRISILQNKHKELHNKIEALYAENAPAAVITKHKKEKLDLKDKIKLLTTKL